MRVPLDLKNELRGAKVIVTGASGFIGLNMVRVLSDLGAEIMVIDRIQPAERLPQVQFEWADLRHLDKVYEADYLIHLAAITNAGFAERYQLDTFEVNVLGTVNLLNHVKINKRILFPSTALTYKASDTPISEEAETDLSSVYALSKNVGEQVVKFHSQRMGVPHTIVRFFNIYGPGQLPMYIVPQVLTQIRDHHRIEIRNGTIMRDLLFVEDCIDAVLKLSVTDPAEDEVFNIGSGHIVSISDVARSAVEASGYDDVEITDLEEFIEYSPTAIMADIDKVQSTIDWYPRTNLKDGLKRMWDAMGNGNAAGG
ncbi:MAG: NAD-dependent epimerase/dehydratase family protein [Nitrospirales bacterium]